MNKLSDRKQLLKRIVKKNYNENSALIYLLIDTGRLDNVIQELDNKRTIPNTTCLLKKSYLTSEEQFIEVLQHIIYRINIDFWFLKKSGNIIIENILNDRETFPLLFSKKYIGNNKYIPYYNLEVKKACIINFYRILKFINITETINDFLQEQHIKLNKIELNNSDDVNNLYQALRLICLCNCNSYGLLYIFDNNLQEKTKVMYQIQLEMLIEKTNEIKNIAEKVLSVIF